MYNYSAILFLASPNRALPSHKCGLNIATEKAHLSVLFSLLLLFGREVRPHRVRHNQGQERVRGAHNVDLVPSTDEPTAHEQNPIREQDGIDRKKNTCITRLDAEQCKTNTAGNGANKPVGTEGQAVHIETRLCRRKSTQEARYVCV